MLLILNLNVRCIIEILCTNLWQGTNLKCKELESDIEEI